MGESVMIKVWHIVMFAFHAGSINSVSIGPWMAYRSETPFIINSSFDSKPMPAFASKSECLQWAQRNIKPSETVKSGCVEQDVSVSND